jgi:hypothetical protein
MKRETGWERWKDAAPSDRDTDSQIGALLRTAGRAPTFSDARLSRIERALVNPRRRERPGLMVRWAVAAGMLLFAGGVFAGVAGPRKVLRLMTTWFGDVDDPVKLASSPVVLPRPARPIDVRVPIALQEKPASGPVVAMAPPVSESPPAVRPRRRLPATSPRIAMTPRLDATLPETEPAVGGSAAGSGLVEEAALLQRAMIRLNKDGDARGALALLDEYGQRFPLGSLSSEAAMARVDAFLVLGRVDEAIALGRNAPDLPLERRRELYVLEAERLAARDCAKAAERFDALLGGSLSASLRERALYGRAMCKRQLGRDAAARADLWQYLDEFPKGRFVAQVQKVLGEP